MYAEISRRWLLAGSLVLIPPLDALAQDPLQEVRDCLKRNVPKSSSKQDMRLVSIDKNRGRSECRGRLKGARLADGLRAMKVCITRPNDVRGTEFLAIEVPGHDPHTWIYLPSERRTIPVTGSGMNGGVCGSDVSYEDVERWQQLNRPERLERMLDESIAGRPVYVVSAMPTETAQSTYTKVLSYIDQKTCVVLKSESFQNGDRLRKRMTVDAEQLVEDHGVWAPSRILVEDLRDESHTTVRIEHFQVDRSVDKRSFAQNELGKHCR